jgi:hypothetical protein
MPWCVPVWSWLWRAQWWRAPGVGEDEEGGAPLLSQSLGNVQVFCCITGERIERDVRDVGKPRMHCLGTTALPRARTSTPVLVLVPMLVLCARCPACVAMHGWLVPRCAGHLFALWPPDLMRVDRSLRAHALLAALWGALESAHAAPLGVRGLSRGLALLGLMDPYRRLYWALERAHFTHLRTALDGAVEGTPGSWSIQVCMQWLP